MANVVQLVCVCLCVSVVTCQFGFFPQREDRRYGSPLQWGANLFNPNTIRETLTGVLHLRPENRESNPNYIYPFRPSGIANDNRQPGPNYPYQNQNQNPNQYYRPYQDYGNIQNGNGNFVVFPMQPPRGPVNFVDNPNYNPGPNNGQNYEGNFNGQNESNEPRNEDSAVIFEDGSTGMNGFPNGIPQEPPNGIPNQPPQGIPNQPPNGIPIEPPQEIPSQPPNGIPIEPPQEIPSQPPSGIPIEPPGGIPDSPPNESSSDAPTSGIPNGPPAGIPDAPPSEEHTELPALTPVPDTEKRNNFNFGSAGIFKETCQTVENQLGSCISILNCRPYLYILQESRSNPQAVQILRRAHCGFEGNNPKVCCPLQGIPETPPPPPPTTTTTVAPAPEPAPKNTGGDFVAYFPEPPVCGVSNASFSRVVGGVNAKLGDFPWMALLGYKSRRGPGARWLCGGSLITSKHVLTAAHCIHNHENDLFLVRLGELDLEREDEGATPVDVLVKSMVKHEQYSPKAFTNDIGILTMDREVEFTNLIKPICIPKDTELRAKTFENFNPIIAGWGDTEFKGPKATHLQALQLPVVSNSFCSNAYSAYKEQKIDERVLCAGYKKGGKDACQGDSGGPLMQPIWNEQDYTTHFYQIGVVSYGKKCAEPGFPGVYSRVTHFVPWLEEKVLGLAAN